MIRSSRVLFAIGALLVSMLAGSAAASTTLPSPSVSFTRFDLTGGTTSGLSSKNGVLTISHGSDGTWLSPPQASFAFDELVASWNATTPANTWITVEMRATGSGRTTKWYTMGIWTSEAVPAHRASVSGQGDANGFVATDTFIRSKKAARLDSYELLVGLHRSGTNATPEVRLIGAMTSADVAKYDIPSAPVGTTLRDGLGVPPYSQEIHTGELTDLDGGGEAWCSPTSTEMIVDKWGYRPSDAELAVFPGTTKPDGTAYRDAQVDFAARGVYDWNYHGAGNWPFNAAYAGSRGLNAFVTRLRSLAEAERFIAAGIPLVASIQGKLPGFFFGKTNGHLLTIVGFTKSGDVISNDPAVPENTDVHKIYGRADFENVWLGGSGGIVYVIYPNGTALPPHMPDLDPNW